MLRLVVSKNGARYLGAVFCGQKKLPQAVGQEQPPRQQAHGEDVFSPRAAGDACLGLDLLLALSSTGRRSGLRAGETGSPITQHMLPSARGPSPRKVGR